MITKKKEKIKSLKESEFLREAEARLKVIYWFFAYPYNAFSLSDLTEELQISKTTANRVVLSLIEEGFLEKEEFGRVWRITCNIKHPYNLTIKVPYHLSLIYNSGILEVIHKEIPNARAVILFGSYRKGDDIEKSDLDIAVEVLDNKPPRIRNLGIIENLGFRKNIPVNLHIFSRNKVDLNLFSNIANGIALSGFLEVHP